MRTEGQSGSVFVFLAFCRRLSHASSGFSSRRLFRARREAPLDRPEDSLPPPPTDETTGASAAAEESAPTKPRDRFVLWTVPAAFVPPLTFLLVSLSWRGHCPPDLIYTGYLQGDQPAYTAFAQAMFHRGNGLFYANPFDFDPAAPRVLTNLGYVALGWLFRALGDRTVLAWEIWRILLGAACYLLFAMIVARLFRSNGLRWLVFIIGAFGAGTAWIVMLRYSLSVPSLGWMGPFAEVEEGYGFWCLNLFRQSLYPLELAYHALFFGSILCYLDGRYRALAALVFLLWWTHPVTALLATTVIGLALLGDWIAARERKPALVLLGLIAVVLPWMVYYRLVLPRYPSVKSWLDQTLAFGSIMQMKAAFWPRAWGVLLAGLPLAACYAPLRRYLWRERAGRLVLFWGLAALAWSHNNLLLHERAIQPMHFTRGYIHLFLLIVTAKGVELWWRAHLETATRKRSQPASAGSSLQGSDLWWRAHLDPAARKRSQPALAGSSLQGIGLWWRAHFILLARKRSQPALAGSSLPPALAGGFEAVLRGFSALQRGFSTRLQPPPGSCAEIRPLVAKKPSVAKRRWMAIVAAVLLVLLLVPDNVLFVARVATELPRRGTLTISPQEKEVIDYFRDQPGSLGIASVNPALGVLLVAHTPHRVYASEEAVTPFHRERQGAAMRLLSKGSAETARAMGVDRVVLVKVEGVPYPRWALDPARFRVLLDNGVYQVGEIADPSRREKPS